MTSMARLVSLAILTCLIVFLGLTFYQIVAPFLLPLFLAAVTAVWCQPLNAYFLKRFRQRDRWAAAATTGTVSLALFLPLIVGVFFAAKQILDFTARKLDGESPTAFVARMLPKSTSEAELKAKIRRAGETVLDYFEPVPAEDAPAEERDKILGDRQAKLDQLEQQFTEATADVGSQLQLLATKSLGFAASGARGTIGVLGAVVGGVISLTIFLIALYYFLCDGSSLLSATEKLIPVQVDYQRQLVHEFNRVVQAVVTATMLSAIAQGAATSLLLYCVGFRSIFLLFVLATFASLIPIAGTWMVWGPFAVWLAYSGSWGSALFVTIVGAVVIGTMDNLIKAYVLQSDTSLHPLLAFVSVFGGMQAMGLWGIFVGPIVACCLHALVKIFNTELSEFSRERFAKKLQNSEDTVEIPALKAEVPVPEPTAKPSGSMDIPASPPAPAAQG
jgi:predicted PurR-regulated permease PerM